MCFGFASAQTAFSCDGAFYQIRNASTSSTLYRIGRSTSPYTVVAVGSATSYRLNALGYNPTDDLLYAIETNSNAIYQIDASGAVVSQGRVIGLPARDYNNGTFDSQGNFYLTFANTNIVYQLTRTKDRWRATALTFNRTVNSGDIALNPVDGLLYGFLDTTLLTYNLSTRQVTSLAVSGYAGGSAGSVFFDATGTFYVYRNAGGFYTINLTTGVATLVSSSSSSTASDGASCVFPDYKIDVVKQTTSVTAVDLRTFDVSFRVTVGNRYTTLLPGVQVNDFIGPGSGTTFATASSVSVTAPPQVTAPCLANSAFGSGDSRLLSGTVSLSAGQSCTVTFSVRVVYPSASSVPSNDPTNTAYASSTVPNPNSGYTLASGVPVPPVQVLAGEASTHSASLPTTASGDTPSPSPVPLPRSPLVTLIKAVRNQSQNGTFGTTASAKPGEVLEYCVQFSNDGSGSAGQFTLTDSLTLEQTFIANSYAGAYGFRLLDASGNETALYTALADSDVAEWNETTGQLSYRPGALAAGSAGSLCFTSQIR